LITGIADPSIEFVGQAIRLPFAEVDRRPEGNCRSRFGLVNYIRPAGLRAVSLVGDVGTWRTVLLERGI